MKLKDLVNATCLSQAMIIWKNGERIVTYGKELQKNRDSELMNSKVEIIEPCEIEFKDNTKCYGLKIDLF